MTIAKTKVKLGWQDAFVTAVRQHGSLDIACQRVGVMRAALHSRMRIDTDFAEQVKQAQEQRAAAFQGRARW